MKKFIALVLAAVTLLSFASCSSGGKSAQNSKASSKPSNSEKDKILEVLDRCGYMGVAIVTKNGKTVLEYANGKDEDGEKLSVKSSMYIGSVSKQFCAAAVMILRDSGKLSVKDKLKKYFPKYKYADRITIKNLLTMRSGIISMVEGKSGSIAPDFSRKKNIKAQLDAIFKEPLNFKPGSKYEYSNSNYFLLSNIVEMVSKKSYIDFIRENIFKPLKMNSSGFVDEVRKHPAWAKGLSYDTFTGNDSCEGVTQGAGDIVSNTKDMSAWMTALLNGKVVKESTFKEMTKNYSPDHGYYGYALEGQTKGGIGHSGLIGNYHSKDYMNKKLGYNIFLSTRNNVPIFENIPRMIINAVG